MRIDHVVYGVAHLETGIRRFKEEFGLTAVEGGAHRDVGTKNALVSVAAGQYIELLAVADPSSPHPIVAALTQLTADADRPIAVCLRPRDLDEVARRLGLSVLPMERQTPEGDVIRWRLAGVEAALGPERLPFFIDWGAAAAELDQVHASRAAADELAWVEVGGRRDRLADWVGTSDVPLRSVDGAAGPHAIHLRRGGETIVIR